MVSLSTFLAWLAVGTNGFLFAASASAFLFIVMIALFLFKAIWKVDLSQMFFEPGSQTVSSSKFWNMVACFVATIAFLFINVTNPAIPGLEFIWLIYMGVIAGTTSVSKLISARYGVADPLAGK